MWSHLGSGALSTLGTLYGNRASAREAARNRDFQAYMSGTAHQREVDDLRAAGLNPILSATGGAGATTPGGAMAPQSGLEEGVSSALNARINKAQVRQLDEAARLTAEQSRTQRSTQKSLDASAKNQLAQSVLAESNTAVSGKQVDKLVKEIKILSEHLTREGFQTTVARDRLPGDRHAGSVHSSSAMAKKRWIDLGLDTAQKATGVLKPFSFGTPKLRVPRKR